MKQIYLLVLLLLSSFFLLQAQKQYSPAYPYPLDEVLPNGSKVKVVVKGDELNSIIETADGYTILRNKSGYFEYALSNKDSLLRLSGIKVNDELIRGDGEIEFLKTLPKGLRAKKDDLPIFKSTSLLKWFPTQGERKILVLLIKYPDMKNTYSATDFSNFFNQPNYKGTGSFRDYYLANSFGKLNITADVFGWYTSAHPSVYYSRNGNDHPVDIVVEAANAAIAAGVDISVYDNDKDGFVDGLMVVHAGPGAEMNDNPNYIWSYSDSGWGTLAIKSNKTTIHTYSIQPETRPWGMVGIGVFCHEFGHLLGLPDLYDTGTGKSAGLGDWCLMAGGGWLNDEKTPACLTAYCKQKLGWISPTVLSSGMNCSLTPSATSSQCYRINTPKSNEFFLIENRQRVGYDAYIPGKGLAIYHIITNQTSNASVSNKLVDLEEADGRKNLDYNTNRGDGGDLFPGTSNNTAFNDTTNPNSKTQTLVSTQTRIFNIKQIGADINFDYNLNEIKASVMPPNSGTISGSGSYSFGSEIKLLATPSDGYVFVGWIENGIRIESEQRLDFTAAENRSLVANFVNVSEGQPIGVFPNPTTKILYITGMAIGGSIQIVNLDGDIIMEVKPNNNQIDVGNLTNGLYLIKIQSKEGLITKRFLKQ